MLNTSMAYFAPTDLQEAVNTLRRFKAKAAVLAGGTDLMIALQKENVKCEALIDIGKIDDIRQITRSGNFLSVGAVVSFSSLIKSPLVRKWAPLLAQAAATVGSPQIRNRGTIGGNIATASPAGDLLTPLVASAAEIIVMGPGGKRRVLVDKLLNNRDGEQLQRDEIICEICIPVEDPLEIRSAFVKLGRRNALSISRLNLALYLKMKDDSIVMSRLAVGAAAPVPFRVVEAEQALLVKEGFKAETVMQAVSRAVADALGDRPSAPYKVIAVKGLVWDALSQCGLVK